jgi:hypothetical protein
LTTKTAGAPHAAITAACGTVAAHSPTTRGPASILAKNEAKKNYIALVRPVVRQIQNWPGTTDADRQALGITIPKNRSDINPPTQPPQMDIVLVNGRRVQIRLHGSDPDRRTKPAGVAGASIYSFSGATPPTDLNQWHFLQSISRTDALITFDNPAVTGSTLWLCARWFNAKQQPGPACDPQNVAAPLGEGAAIAGAIRKAA